MPTILTPPLAVKKASAAAMGVIPRSNWRWCGLYEATGEKRYVEFAKYLVDERGQPDPHYYDIEALAPGRTRRNSGQGVMSIVRRIFPSVSKKRW